MAYHEVEFLTSSPKVEDCPQTDLPEFVLAGRSNVGKSSLINALVDRKKAAYVGNKPGKTRFLNFFKVDNRCIFVDVPGYGFANRSQKELIQFGEMMDGYFTNRQHLRALILIVDYRHKPTKDDITMIEYARELHMSIVVVATKKDKCKRSELSKLKKCISETLGVPTTSILDFSSTEKEGVDELWGIIDSFINDK
ncbi:ribosome biogenesis GTP-binding protein YihA/YsxC [Anaerorhabdus furcosa]|uniref:Probable GTP-binding protein EngB n=1 Tax=Anaerorhabdus furcosa TaxID=118967 RepID=A0A1T4PJK1_9FIRM|nr:ribosome biogenesis GTP-binding protein YihA/YsxC [Anaerorhabdus furcosa]SJZ91396.1 GTP-binding protein [Anaerorhabdus furcosa]